MIAMTLKSNIIALADNAKLLVTNKIIISLTKYYSTYRNEAYDDFKEMNL